MRRDSLPLVEPVDPPTRAVPPGEEAFDREDRAVAELRQLLKAIHSVRGRPDLPGLAGGILGVVLDATPAERGVVALLGREGRPGPTWTADRRGAAPPLRLSRGVLDRVVTRREALWYRDIRDRTRLGERRSLASRAVRSIVAVPFLDRDRAVGVLYLESQETELDASAFRTACLIAAECAPEVVHMARLDRAMRALDASRGGSEGMLGETPPFRKLLEAIDRLAPTEAPVLIVGETGTGKERTARALHDASPRRNDPFVAVNCGAIPEALFESELFGHRKGAFSGAEADKPGRFPLADGGTLFLDEVGETPPAQQVKLLRALEEGSVWPVGGVEPIPVDVRVIAATNRDLGAAVEEGNFRRDLFYRLRVVELPLPPLRERTRDIDLLAGRFLEDASRRCGRRYQGFDPDALDLLRRYRWPGNVRELRNVVERAALLAEGESIRGGDLPPELHDDAPPTGVRRGPERTLAEIEREHVARVLDHVAWNKGRACEILGIARPTLNRKIAEYDLNPAS